MQYPSLHFNLFLLFCLILIKFYFKIQCTPFITHLIISQIWIDFVFLRPSQQFFSHVGMGPPGLISTKQRIKCLAQGHNAVALVRLEPATPQSPVKHSTSEPLCPSDLD